MKTSSFCQSAALAAALLALTMGVAHAQKASREANASAQGPRGLITGKVSPQIVQRADGSQEIESDESMMHTLVLVRQADGTMKQICVHDREVARRLSAGLPVSAKDTMEHSHDR